MPRATLTAAERIKKSQEITTLIHAGRAFFLAPYKVYYSLTEHTEPKVRVAFAVPKKKFGKAVMRNKLKRLGRESFRLQKENLQTFCTAKNVQVEILFLYQKTNALPNDKLYTAIGKAIDTLIEHNG